jgi:plasmid stabilization system protein ParE
MEEAIGRSVMETHRLIITPRAADDLEEIYDVISKDSAQNAARTVSRIIAAIETLIQVPHRTVVEYEDPKLRHDVVRSLPVRPYIVYFRVLDLQKVVRVTHIRHGARRPPTHFD